MYCAPPKREQVSDLLLMLKEYDLYGKYANSAERLREFTLCCYNTNALEIRPMQNIIISDDNTGKRLDKYLEAQYPGVSYNQICVWIRKKKIRLNGKHAKDPKSILRGGDELRLFLSDQDYEDAKAKRTKKAPPKHIKIEILYVDEDFMVINKPIGLLVVPSKNDKETSLNDVSGFENVKIVHRLDRDTGGCMILAKTQETEDYFFDAFKQRKVDKAYLALVHGIPDLRKGVIDTPLQKDDHGRKKVHVAEDSDRGKEAITHYEVEETYEKHAVLRIRIETGRTHQIRVHLASIGHPICFDDQYGDRKKDKELKKISKLRTHFLFASKISFRHPKSGEEMQFEVEMGGRMKELIRSLAS